MGRGLRTVIATAAACAGMASVPALAAADTTVPSGTTIPDGQTVVSGSHTLAMQTDGNLVLYAGSQSTWQSQTYPNPGASAVMQSDGNLVVYSSADRPLWQSGTYNNPGAYLVVQDDGNMVVYSAVGQPLWATNTVDGATATAEAAARWAEQQIGQRTTTANPNSQYWSGWCEAFAEAAYGNRFRYTSAIAQFSEREAQGQIHNDGSVPPRGALVFYGGGNGYGHVAVSVGGGQVVSTIGYVGYDSPVQEVPYRWFSNPYLGWALPY